MRIRQVPIPEVLGTGDYEGDPALRSAFHQWLDQLWREKDRQIGELLGKAGAV